MAWHIIGSNGYIASRLLQMIPVGEDIFCYSRCAGENKRALDLTGFDESNLSEVKNGDFVVMLAAASSPDFCQKYQSEAYAINVIGTERLIRICLDKGARVLFFSSDAVVGATSNPCNEMMTVNPVGMYGFMKRTIELEFLENPHFKVFRLSYVFSRDDKFMRYLNYCIKEDQVAAVYQALYRNVIYLQDVIDAVIALRTSFDTWETGVFHLSGPQLLCRADMADCYKQAAAPRLQFNVTVPDTQFFDARPNCIETASLYLEKLLGRPPVRLEKAMRNEFQ